MICKNCGGTLKVVDSKTEAELTTRKRVFVGCGKKLYTTERQENNSHYEHNRLVSAFLNRKRCQNEHIRSNRNFIQEWI